MPTTLTKGAKDLVTSLVNGMPTDPDVLTVLHDVVTDLKDPTLMGRLLANRHLPTHLAEQVYATRRAWAQQAVAATTDDEALLARLARTAAITVRRRIAGRPDLPGPVAAALADGKVDTELLGRAYQMARTDTGTLEAIVLRWFGHDPTAPPTMPATSREAWLAIRRILTPDTIDQLHPTAAALALFGKMPAGDMPTSSDRAPDMGAVDLTELLRHAIAGGRKLDSDAIARYVSRRRDGGHDITELALTVVRAQNLRVTLRLKLVADVPADQQAAMLHLIDEPVLIACRIPRDLADLAVAHLDATGSWDRVFDAGAAITHPTVLAAAIDRAGGDPDRLEAVLTATFSTELSSTPGGPSCLDRLVTLADLLTPALRDRLATKASALHRQGRRRVVLVDHTGGTALEHLVRPVGTATYRRVLARTVEREFAGNPAALRALLALNLDKTPVGDAIKVALTVG